MPFCPYCGLCFDSVASIKAHRRSKLCSEQQRQQQRQHQRYQNYTSPTSASAPSPPPLYPRQSSEPPQVEATNGYVYREPFTASPMLANSVPTANVYTGARNRYPAHYSYAPHNINSPSVVYGGLTGAGPVTHSLIENDLDTFLAMQQAQQATEVAEKEKMMLEQQVNLVLPARQAQLQQNQENLKNQVMQLKLNLLAQEQFKTKDSAMETEYLRNELNAVRSQLSALRSSSKERQKTKSVNNNNDNDDDDDDENIDYTLDTERDYVKSKENGEQDDEMPHRGKSLQSSAKGKQGKMHCVSARRAVEVNDKSITHNRKHNNKYNTRRGKSDYNSDNGVKSEPYYGNDSTSDRRRRIHHHHTDSAYSRNKYNEYYDDIDNDNNVNDAQENVRHVKASNSKKYHKQQQQQQFTKPFHRRRSHHTHMNGKRKTSRSFSSSASSSSTSTPSSPSTNSSFQSATSLTNLPTSTQMFYNDKYDDRYTNSLRHSAKKTADVTQAHELSSLPSPLRLVVQSLHAEIESLRSSQEKQERQLGKGTAAPPFPTSSLLDAGTHYFKLGTLQGIELTIPLEDIELKVKMYYMERRGETYILEPLAEQVIESNVPPLTRQSSSLFLFTTPAIEFVVSQPKDLLVAVVQLCYRGQLLYWTRVFTKNVGSWSSALRTAPLDLTRVLQETGNEENKKNVYKDNYSVNNNDKYFSQNRDNDAIDIFATGNNVNEYKNSNSYVDYYNNIDDKMQSVNQNLHGKKVYDGEATRVKEKDTYKNEMNNCSYVTTGIVGGTIEVDNRDIVNQAEELVSKNMIESRGSQSLSTRMFKMNAATVGAVDGNNFADAMSRQSNMRIASLPGLPPLPIMPDDLPILPGMPGFEGPFLPPQLHSAINSPESEVAVGAVIKHFSLPPPNGVSLLQWIAQMDEQIRVVTERKHKQQQEESKKVSKATKATNTAATASDKNGTEDKQKDKSKKSKGNDKYDDATMTRKSKNKKINSDSSVSSSESDSNEDEDNESDDNSDNTKNKHDKVKKQKKQKEDSRQIDKEAVKVAKKVNEKESDTPVKLRKRMLAPLIELAEENDNPLDKQMGRFKKGGSNNSSLSSISSTSVRSLTSNVDDDNDNEDAWKKNKNENESDDEIMEEEEDTALKNINETRKIMRNSNEGNNKSVKKDESSDEEDHYNTHHGKRVKQKKLHDNANDSDDSVLKDNSNDEEEEENEEGDNGTNNRANTLNKSKNTKCEAEINKNDNGDNEKDDEDEVDHKSVIGPEAKENGENSANAAITKNLHFNPTMQGLRKRLGARTVNVTEVPRVADVINNSTTANNNGQSNNIRSDTIKEDGADTAAASPSILRNNGSVSTSSLISSSLNGPIKSSSPPPPPPPSQQQVQTSSLTPSPPQPHPQTIAPSESTSSRLPPSYSSPAKSLPSNSGATPAANTLTPVPHSSSAVKTNMAQPMNLNSERTNTTTAADHLPQSMPPNGMTLIAMSSLRPILDPNGNLAVPPNYKNGKNPPALFLDKFDVSSDRNVCVQLGLARPTDVRSAPIHPGHGADGTEASVYIDGVTGVPFAAQCVRVLLYVMDGVDPATPNISKHPLHHPSALMRKPDLIAYQDFNTPACEPKFNATLNLHINDRTHVIAIVEFITAKCETPIVLGHACLPVNKRFFLGNFVMRLKMGDPRRSQERATDDIRPSERILEEQKRATAQYTQGQLEASVDAQALRNMLPAPPARRSECVPCGYLI